MTTKKHTKFQQKRSKIAFIGGASYISCGDFPYNHETNHDLFPLGSLLNFPKEITYTLYCYSLNRMLPQ